MNRLFRLVALVALLCFPMKIEAQYQLIELADVQLAKSLGATIQDPTGAPVPKAAVQEFTANWKTVLRSGSTDTHGKFSFAPAPGRTIYFIQISALGFDPLRFRLQVDTKRPILLAAAGGESPHAAAVWRHAAKDCGASITSRIGEP